MIFVFGSNLAGIHGAGAAKYALQNEGAVWGKGIGHFGNSYAIPTKDHRIHTLSLDHISDFTTAFIAYAIGHPKLQFKVTQIGCGLAGYKPEDIAPLFKDAPDNCYFDLAWMDYLPEGKHYWN